MELKEFLKDGRIRQNRFAEIIAISKNYLSEIVNKKRRPSPDLALRIEEATCGKVDRLELLYPDAKD